MIRLNEQTDDSPEVSKAYQNPSFTNSDNYMMDLFDNNRKTIRYSNSATVRVARGNYAIVNLNRFLTTYAIITQSDFGACYGIGYIYRIPANLCCIACRIRSRHQ